MDKTRPAVDDFFPKRRGRMNRIRIGVTAIIITLCLDRPCRFVGVSLPNLTISRMSMVESRRERRRSNSARGKAGCVIVSIYFT
jgi:hypothetical protein